MLSGAAKRKKKKNEEEQNKKQRGALQKFLSGSRPTAVNLLVSAEPEAEPGPQPEAEPGPQPEAEPGPEPGPETRPEDAAEDAVAPSTSAPSKNDKMMEEQQPARKSEPNIILTEPLDPVRVLTSYPSDPAKWDQIDDRMREYFARNHPSQNIGDFSASKRKYGDINRSLTKEHFFRKKLNGETLSRKWLVYSPSTGSLMYSVTAASCSV